MLIARYKQTSKKQASKQTNKQTIKQTNIEIPSNLWSTSRHRRASSKQRNRQWWGSWFLWRLFLPSRIHWDYSDLLRFLPFLQYYQRPKRYWPVSSQWLVQRLVLRQWCFGDWSASRSRGDVLPPRSSNRQEHRWSSVWKNSTWKWTLLEPTIYNDHKLCS